MPIYTRRGDHGDTSLADGQRVAKTSARVEAYGTVDEANSAVGFARAVVECEIDGVRRYLSHSAVCRRDLSGPAGGRR